MSTVIANGVRFVSQDIFEIHHQLLQWRERVRVLASTAAAKHLAERAVFHHDRAVVKGEPLNKSWLGDAYDDLRDRQRKIKQTMERDPDVDFDFSLTLMPFEGAFYGMLFCEQTAWVRSFQRKGWTTPFSYWDGDRPSHVSAGEWAERERVWDAIFDQGPRPTDCGFSVDCTPQLGYPTIEKVLKHVPTHATRVQRMAKEVVCDAKYAELEARIPEEMRMRSMIRLVMSAAEHLRTPEGEAEVAARAVEIAPLLPPMSKELLLGR